MGCCSIVSRMVGVCSIARRKRNHVVSGMRRAACGWHVAEIENDQAEASAL